MKNIFTEHPHSINETYFQHLKFAGLFGIRMMMGGLACMAHAIFPFLFQKTGSNLLLKMTHHFVERMPKLEGRVSDLFLMMEAKKVQVQTEENA
jgi:hypothetical protein